MEPAPKITHHDAAGGTWISWLGAPTQFFALGEDTGGTYCLSRARSNPGGGAPPHRHPFEEGFYLLSGTLEFTAGSQTVDLGAGDFINIGSDVPHAIRNTSGAPAEALTIAAPSGFDQFQLEGGFPMGGAGGSLIPLDDSVRAKVRAAANNHGVELDLPPDAFVQEGRVTVTRKGEGVAIDAVGDRYRFLAEGGSTDGRYAIWEALLSPGGGPPPHTHTREEEGFFILDGTVSFHSGDSSFSAGPGAFVNLPKNREHWFRNAGSSNARALIIVAPAGLEEMFRITGRPVDDLSAPIASRMDSEKGAIIEVAAQFGLTLGTL